MGCQLGRFTRQKSTYERRLSTADMDRLSQIWDMINVDRVCLNALVAVLNSKPQLLIYFGIDPTTATELIECPKLISHARMIAGFLTKIVRNMDPTMGNASHLLASVGAIHFHKGVNFTAENYLVFKRMFANSMSEQLARASGEQMNPFRKLTTSSMRSKTSVSISISGGMTEHRMGGDDVIIEKFLALVIRKLRDGFLHEAVRERPPKTAVLINA